MHSKNYLIEICSKNDTKLMMCYETINDGRGSEVFNFKYTNHMSDFLNYDRVPLTDNDIGELLKNGGVLRKEICGTDGLEKVYCFCLGI